VPFNEPRLKIDIVKNWKAYNKKIDFYQSWIGLILGLVVICSIMQYKIFKLERCIVIRYLAGTYPEPPKDYYQNLLPAERNFKTIEIVLNKYDSKIEELYKIIYKIETSKDTLNGVKIVFNKEIKYKHYIETINTLLKLKVKTYLPIGDTIYYYYLNRFHEDDDLDDNYPIDPFLKIQL
jgi:hypothetical protein